MEKNKEPQVVIYTRNMELDDSIDNYVNKKVDRFIRHLAEIDEIRVDLSSSNSARNAADRKVAQITLKGKRLLLRAEERADDLFAAFDSAVDKMDRQIAHYKGKHYRGPGDRRSFTDVIQDSMPDILPDEEDEEFQESLIARRKKFTLYPMDEFEAIEQMKLLGHENFFIFYNANSEKINVLYRRRDGTYGLIDPDVG
ncbi:MAG: ribosome-associated translation inhibitor RaiA [Anaerolineaceae bacterium]|nr:ribosome-associated translation inhibitor RaiA [Anaerolineaceae bacterium]